LWYQFCLATASLSRLLGGETSLLRRGRALSGVAYGMTDQAIGRELNKLGLECDTKKVNGKAIKVRKFITRKE